MSEQNPTGGWSAFDEFLPFASEEILLEWRALVRHEPPWNAMPLDDLDGHLPRVLGELLNLAQEVDQATRRHGMIVGSRAHGAFRRQQRCPADSIRSEFVRLGLAIQNSLQRAGFRNRLSDDVFSCLEPDLNLARLAAARGFDTGLSDERSSRPPS